MLHHHGGPLNVTRNQAAASDQLHRETTIIRAKMAQVKIKASDNHRANHKVNVKVKDSHAEMVALIMQVVKVLAEVVKDDRTALTPREEAVAKLHRLHSLRITFFDGVLARPSGVFLYCTYFYFSFAFSPRLVLDIRAWWLSVQISGSFGKPANTSFGYCSRPISLLSHDGSTRIPAQESPAELHLDSLVSYDNPCSLRLFFG